MVVWGLDLLVLVTALSKMMADLTSWTDKELSYFTGALSALAVVFFAKVGELEMLWPPLAEWGPIVFAAVAMFLSVVGYMPALLRTSSVVARKLGL